MSKAGELKAIEGKLTSSLRKLLGVDEKFQIFVPYASYTKGGRTVSVRLIEGYAFVATGLSEVQYFRLERSPFVSKVFSVRGPGGIRALKTIPNREIEGMRESLANSLSSDLELGAKVRITDGTYRDLEGVVVDLYDQRVAVKVSFRSLISLAVLPRNIVTFATEEGSPLDAAELPEILSLDELRGAGL